MHYLSTRNSYLKESFETILFQGLSKEGGLFLPHTWPSINIRGLDIITNFNTGTERLGNIENKRSNPASTITFTYRVPAPFKEA